MLKAGALYFAIIVAFLIAIITASLILLAAHYRASYQKEQRYNRLLSNLNSGMIILLSDTGSTVIKKEVDLFGEQTDSVYIERRTWGVYELGIVKSHIMRDTLSKVFFIGGNTLNDQDVLYLSDEDRPLSVSGQTQITGDGALPKSGIKKSYAEGKPYIGDKLLYGKSSYSKRELGELNSTLVKQIQDRIGADLAAWPLLDEEIINTSFTDSTSFFCLSSEHAIDGQLSGNIVLVSDSVVTISSSAKLENVQIYAQSIIVEDGFKGNCQLYARDSIVVGKDVEFTYPTVVGVLRTSSSIDQPKITFGDNLVFNGIVFSYEEQRTPLQTLIGFGKDSRLTGEIYADGLLKIEKGFYVAGKVSCNRFVMETPTTLYENFLIDVTFNRKARSEYYLSSPVFFNSGKRKVLKWLK